jgi:hypothetical protein
MVERQAAEAERLARLERRERQRMDAAVDRARAELASAMNVWGSWSNYMRQRRELALGRHDRYGAILTDSFRVADPIEAALHALADYRSPR